MEKLSLFFDDGGVMNDDNKRGKQWQRLVAEYFVPRYGGDPERWGKANLLALDHIISKIKEKMLTNTEYDYIEFQKFENQTWITVMFDCMNLQLPPEEDYYRIHREVEAWITPQIKADVKGIITVIKQLKNQGYNLYTASGSSSWSLRGYLTGMGIVDNFIELFGPDLVGIMKGSITYYQRIFEHAQVLPTHAIVIDDNPQALQLAKQLGALTIQSCAVHEITPRHNVFYTDPAELPKLLESILE